MGIISGIALLREVLPEWIAVTLGFIVVGGGLMWPLTYIQDICGRLMDNHCDRGIYSIKIMLRIYKSLKHVQQKRSHDC